MSKMETYNLINTALQCMNKVDIDDIPSHYVSYVELLQVELEDLRDMVAGMLPRKDVTTEVRFRNEQDELQ